MPFSPPSGCVLWLDAAAQSYTNGQPVTTGVDSSGAGHNLTVPGGMGAPMFTTNYRNGLPVIQFAAGRSTELQALFTLPQPSSLIAYYRLRPTISAATSVPFDGASAFGSAIIHYGDHWNQGLYAGNGPIFSPSAACFEWLTLAATLNGMSSTISVNGASPVTGDIGSGVPGGLVIGGAGGGGAYYCDLDLAEVLVFSRVLNSSDISSVTGYLDGKWNPTVSVGKLVSAFGSDVGYRQALTVEGSSIIHDSYISNTTNTPEVQTTCGLNGTGAASVSGTTFGNTFNTDSQYTGLAIQPDGKIVRAGYTSIPTGMTTKPGFLFARFNTDGTLDTGFGTAGYTRVLLPGAIGSWADAVVVLSNGKIVAGGADQSTGGYQSVSGVLGAYSDFALVGLNSDGSLDTGFGTAGILTFSLDGGTGGDQINGMAIDPTTGNIVCGGLVIVTNPGTIGLARVTPSGVLDTTFGGGGTGWVVTSAISDRDRAHAFAVDSSSKVLFASAQFDTPNGFRINRINQDGTPDTTFNSTGFNAPYFGTNNEAVFDLKIDGNGKILACGWCYHNLSKFNIAIVRLNSDGTLDSSFADSGQLEVDLGTDDDEAFIAYVLPSNDILFGGFTHTADTRYDLALIKVSGSTGIPDPTFAQSGTTTGAAALLAAM